MKILKQWIRDKITANAWTQRWKQTEHLLGTERAGDLDLDCKREKGQREIGGSQQEPDLENQGEDFVLIVMEIGESSCNKDVIWIIFIKLVLFVEGE